jgi:Lectin C-type domain
MKLIRFVALPLLAAPALAQGSDSCAAAQLIAGTGLFAFDNSAATTDGAPSGLCNFSGQTQIEHDVWFEWVAPASGPYLLSLCGQASIDSKVAVYDGSCAGALLACNDDSCALQSQLMFNASNSQTYILRIGTYPGTAGGTGNIDIESAILRTVTNPANGHTYQLLPSSSWTVAEAAAVALGGHLATVRSQAEQDFLNQNFHNYQGTDIDLWIGFNDAAVEGTFVWVSGETPGYTDWDLGEPNNSGGNEDYAIMRKNNPAAFWNDVPDDPIGFHAGPHGLVETGGAISVFCTGDGLDPLVTTACPCANTGAAGRGCDNSAGTGGARLDSSGSTTPDTLVLSASGELPNALSIFLQGSSTAAGGLVFGDGVRCVSGVLKRLYIHNAAGGIVSAPAAGELSVSARSAALGDPIAPGSQRWYQVYSRDPSASFCPAPSGNTYNISSGLQVDW